MCIGEKLKIEMHAYFKKRANERRRFFLKLSSDRRKFPFLPEDVRSQIILLPPPAKVPSKSKDCASAARPAVSQDTLRQPVGILSLRDEFTLLAVIGWISLLRRKSEAVPMMRKDPTENMSEIGQASSHSFLGMVGGTLALKLRRRKHMASGAFLRRSSCCGARDPVGGDFHVPQLLCPVFSVWPVVRGRVVVGGAHVSLRPVAQHHSASEIKGSQPQLARS